MKHCQDDAEVLYAAARRLFDESAESFRRAHANGLGSEDALTVEKQLELFDEVIEEKKQAIATQAAAIENQKQAFRILANARD